eukprot:g51368.t1
MTELSCQEYAFIILVVWALVSLFQGFVFVIAGGHGMGVVFLMWGALLGALLTVLWYWKEPITKLYETCIRDGFGYYDLSTHADERQPLNVSNSLTETAETSHIRKSRSSEKQRKRKAIKYCPQRKGSSLICLCLSAGLLCRYCKARAARIIIDRKSEMDALTDVLRFGLGSRRGHGTSHWGKQAIWLDHCYSKDNLVVVLTKGVSLLGLTSLGLCSFTLKRLEQLCRLDAIEHVFLLAENKKKSGESLRRLGSS